MIHRFVSAIRARSITLALLTMVLVLIKPMTWAQNFTTLYTFTGKLDGATPQSTLIRDAQGNLYGTTYHGGAFGLGAVFMLEPGGKEKPLHSFSGVDGMSPDGKLVRDSAGNLYGTTLFGGTPENGSCVHGCGTVFKLDPQGKFTTLYAFKGKADGGEPSGNLVRDAEGNLYGAVQYDGPGGYGGVFKIDSNGKESLLYGFGALPDGERPEGGVIRDSSGNLYGNTLFGGSGGGNYGYGTVFKVDSSGKETVLYSFTGGADGGGPSGTLVRDPSGNLYGTTRAGGLGYGTVFKLDPAGKETVPYAFPGGADGECALGRRGPRLGWQSLWHNHLWR